MEAKSAEDSKENPLVGSEAKPDTDPDLKPSPGNEANRSGAAPTSPEADRRKQPPGVGRRKPELLDQPDILYEPVERLMACAWETEPQQRPKAVLSDEAVALCSPLKDEFQAALIEGVDYPYRKLTDDQFFNLFCYFVLEQPVSAVASRVGTAQRTVLVWWKRFRQKILWAAAAEDSDYFFKLGQVLRDPAQTHLLFYSTRAESALAVEARLKLRRQERKQNGNDEDFSGIELNVNVVELCARAHALRQALEGFEPIQRDRRVKDAFARAHRGSKLETESYLATHGIALERHDRELLLEFARAFSKEFVAVLESSPLSTEFLNEEELLAKLHGLRALSRG